MEKIVNFVLMLVSSLNFAKISFWSFLYMYISDYVKHWYMYCSGKFGVKILKSDRKFLNVEYKINLIKLFIKVYLEMTK